MDFYLMTQIVSFAMEIWFEEYIYSQELHCINIYSICICAVQIKHSLRTKRPALSDGISRNLGAPGRLLTIEYK
jgi:hypothetical protein